jgi:predicted transcriptional regulator
MPDYREVLRLPVRRLINLTEDAPRIVTTETKLQDVLSLIRDTPISAVAVTDAKNPDRAVGVIEESTIIDALAQGRGLDAPCGDVATTQQIFRDTTSLDTLRTLLGPFRTLLIVNNSRKPIGHITRDTLADRISALA